MNSPMQVKGYMRARATSLKASSGKNSDGTQALKPKSQDSNNENAKTEPLEEND